LQCSTIPTLNGVIGPFGQSCVKMQHGWLPEQAQTISTEHPS
jgi:hypothetical protein